MITDYSMIDTSKCHALLAVCVSLSVGPFVFGRCSQPSPLSCVGFGFSFCLFLSFECDCWPFVPIM